MTRETPNLIRAIEAYLQQYVVFSAPSVAFVAALWVVATYLWPDFDAFPYLVISSPVKRSGKTRFSEVLDFCVANGRRFTAATVSTIFASIKDESPVIFIDEAETLSREAASDMRALLNMGYRKGATIPRRAGGATSKVIEWPVYCPKVFILIGDVFDTLRDRSIVVEMMRGEPAKRFSYNAAKAEGGALGATVQAAVADAKAALLQAYEATVLPFLMDRDEEIWRPLFAVAHVFAPERRRELGRTATDLATLKTVEKRTYRELAMSERDVEQGEYAQRLLHDLFRVLDGKTSIYTDAAVTALRDLDTAPWRTFRGEGLTAYTLADLLKPFGVAPRLIKTGRKATGTKVARGYRKADLEHALAGKTPASRHPRRW